MSGHEIRAARRASAKKRRDGMKPEQRAAASARITRSVTAMPEWRGARSVFIYHAFGSEFDTLPLINEALDSGMEVYLPRCGPGGMMDAVRVTSLEGLTPGPYGIPEPAGDEILNGDPDIAIVPGLAFDRRGNRLGYGGGYYDRYLSRSDALRIAPVFDIQVGEDMAPQPHDVPMDVLVTENETIFCGGADL